MIVEKSKKCLCPCCMEEHELKTIALPEKATFKNVNVSYEAVYLYCDKAEELYTDEQQMRQNDIRMKDAYRKHEGLLTSSEIGDIRAKYGISQSDLCSLLGWGGKTVTRYEGHQVQDRAHDMILRKIDSDPEWFLSLLDDAKNDLKEDTFRKYRKNAIKLYENEHDLYLRKAIEASYIKFHDKPMLCGNTMLSLDKTVDIIRYFAASKQVIGLYKVKLMKLMWYADALSYKKRGFSITGLVYRAYPMGAVPIGYNSIIDLTAVPCEEVEIGETSAYRFELKDMPTFDIFSNEDVDILDNVAEKLGKMSTNEIVDFMHQEKAYIKTAPFEPISFEYAHELQI